MITLEELQAVARVNDGRILRTAAGQAKFLLKVHSDGLEYTPLSTKATRFLKYEQIKRFLDRYNQLNSMRTSDYGSFDVNASYTLRLIKLAADIQRENS